MMTLPQPYNGPTALAYSKYASPHMKRAQLATLPLEVSSASNAPAQNAIATKKQIAASHGESTIDMVTQNSDAELAVAQGNALKEEVEKHAAKISRTISNAVTNTRQLLELIRQAVQKDNPSALKDVDHLWAELEQLFEAVKDAKDALPEFLEKQRNNMALYHTSVMNETYRESQDELNMQHKKVNLQHGLILEHQQAFQDYKTKMASKLKDFEKVREKASRLTLEKGNFRDEVDRHSQLLEQEKATRIEDLEKARVLQTELDGLRTSNKQLLAEIERSQKTTSDLQEKMQAAEHEMIDRFAAELKEKTDMLAKETAKTASLNTLINTLKGHESNVNMEIDKIKAESRMTNEKFNRMAAEHSQAFSKSKEQTKKIETLTADAERLRKVGADLKQCLAKPPDFEKTNAGLFEEKANMLEQIGKLRIELGEVKDSCVKVNKELAGLIDKLQKVRKENENLENRNKDLLAKEVKSEEGAKSAAQAARAVSILKSENAKFRIIIDELKANQTAPAVGAATPTDKDKVDLQEKIQGLQKQKIALQAALEEWTTLAKRSYKEYKDMLPTYKQADQYRREALVKDDQIEDLKLELSAAKASHLNGVGSSGDATYWKDKYDNLLSNIGG